MGATGPVNPMAAGQPPGRRTGGSLAALTRAAVRAPFTARARRELLFCLVEVPLGLSVVAVPIALAGVPLTVTLLAQGTSPPGRPAQAHPAGVLAIFAGMFVLLLLVILAPRAARWLAAGHRHLAARLLGERVAGPPPVRGARGVVRRLDATLRDGPGGLRRRSRRSPTSARPSCWPTPPSTAARARSRSRWPDRALRSCCA